MSDADNSSSSLVRFGDVPWIEQREGLRGKRLTEGLGGFWLQLVEMAPGFEVTPHHHSADELIHIVDGGCTFGPDKIELGPNDSAVLAANHDYGFTVGETGMRFVIVRREAAMNSRAK